MITVKNLSFSFTTETQTFPIIKDLSFTVGSGEFVAIQGPSGSGKSTMLYLLGGLLRFQSGEILIDDVAIRTLSDDALCLFRNQNIGFVFQQFHLLPKTSVLENILLPQYYPLEKIKIPMAHSVAKARQLAEYFDLTNHLTYFPNELSGGLQQRVAIARALVNHADLILADEPTGNLDSVNSKRVMDHLLELNAQGKTVVVITHDTEIAAYADRVIHLRDGMLDRVEFKKIYRHTSAIRKPEEVAKNSHFSHVLKHSIELAVKNLTRQWRRSILTAVGIIVGIAAVLSMITLGHFTQDKVIASYADLGVNTLLFYGWPSWNLQAKDSTPLPYRGFDWEKDLKPLYKIFPGIDKITPRMSRSNIGSVSYGGKKIENDLRITGYNEHGVAITKRKIAQGRSISVYDVQNRNAVCMIGSEIATRLYSNEQPVGRNIYLNGEKGSTSCRVIAVFMPLSAEKNKEIYLPDTFAITLAQYSWDAHIYEILLELRPGQDIERVGKGIENFFKTKYGKSGSFDVDSNSVLIVQMTRFLQLFTVLLSVVAFLSLAVGAIGIMNMMLVSVAERLREIGLRKALGATNRSIRWQFLAESIVLCTVAGVVGMLLGVLVYESVIFGATKFVKNLPFEWRFDFWAISIAGFSVILVGIGSGIVPALKAEKLQVIAALRSE